MLGWLAAEKRPVFLGGAAKSAAQPLRKYNSQQPFVHVCEHNWRQLGAPGEVLVWPLGRRRRLPEKYLVIS